MRKILSWVFKIVIGLIVVAALLVLRSLIIGGAFTSLDETLTSQCERIPTKPGAEDITIDHAKGLAFVSAEDRRARYAGKTPQRGGLFVFNVSDPAGTIREVALDGPADFQPHGIGLYKGEGMTRLFVVSHPVSGGHVIETFDVSETGDLTHVDSIRDPGMHSPNDVIPVGPRQFYVTNDHPPYEGTKAVLEQYLLMANTNALYYDGEKAVEVAAPLKSANGINVSADGQQVYISEVTGKRISVYDRDMSTNMLTRVKGLKVNTLPDNVERGPNGMLYTGGHTKIFDYLDHAAGGDKIAVTHVVRIDPETGETKDVLVNIDGTYQAGTVGAVTDNRLFVGSVFEDGILSCPL